MACTCRHYACTCSHYTGTTLFTGTIQVSEQLVIWKRDAYLRSCTYAQRRIHFLMPQQKELSEQVNSMKILLCCWSSKLCKIRFGLPESNKNLPDNVLPHFLKGQHVTRHMNGLWIGIWSDMFIESTFMRYGHGWSGIVGITLKPETLKTWALSRHICSQLMEDLAELRADSDDNRLQDHHKLKSTARMVSDKKDREALKSKLEVCIHPLNPEVHPEQLVNVANGTIGASEINVEHAVRIGHSQMLDFEKALPTGFWTCIERKIKTMARSKPWQDQNHGKIKTMARSKPWQD